MIGCIIQARSGSTRLPNKVLLPLGGKPVLQHVVERCRRIRGVDRIVVGTSFLKQDDKIVDLCYDIKVPCFTGNHDDVLDRYYRCAKFHGFNTIVRVTADCPVLDPEISTRVLDHYRQGGYEYTSNVHPATFPDGLDTEVFSFQALEKAWQHAKDPFEREHVTPYLWRWPQPVKTQNVWNLKDLSDHRWTLDTREDYEFLVNVFKTIKKGMFHMDDILALPIQRTMPRKAVL